MGYSAEISRDNPGSLFFLIDQSGSMFDKMAHGKSKAEFVADVLNKTIYTLVTSCTKSDGTRNYFDVGVISYSGDGVLPGLGGLLSGSTTHSISKLAEAPLRVEDRSRLEDDGAGGVIERRIKFPVWFEPRNSGGTPMCSALSRLAEELRLWCAAHPNSYPPTVLHVTDGEATDGDPEEIASSIRKVSTGDGECLLFNIHVSTGQGESVQFPSDIDAINDEYGKLLFRMSSVLPAHVLMLARDRGYKLADGARGFMFNADPKDITSFFDIGTRPRLTADR